MTRMILLLCMLSICSCARRVTSVVTDNVQANNVQATTKDTVYSTHIVTRKDTMYIITKKDTVKYINNMLLTAVDTIHKFDFITLHDTLYEHKDSTIVTPRQSYSRSITSYVSLIIVACIMIVVIVYGIRIRNR